MLTTISAKYFDINFISHYYGWSYEYTIQVIFEYERFLQLRYIEPKLSPSDTIDKLWHIHILDTSSYFSYCIYKFKKIIHHNPADSLDKEARKIRMANTQIKYFKKFGEYKYPQVWMNEIENFNPKNLTIPTKSKKFC